MTDWSSLTGALAARVRGIVFEHLFGVGIVETAANFGVSGMKPTHPDVLEHLASYFVTHQRKLKPLLKHIMTSQVYMQVSTVGESKQSQKPKTLIQITGCCGDRICGVWKQKSFRLRFIREWHAQPEDGWQV